MDFFAKTVGIGVAVGMAGLCVGPVAAVAGVGAVLYARGNMISLASAFNGRLDEILRSKAAAGYRISLIQRFSRSIDRLACCASVGQPGEEQVGLALNVKAGPQQMSKQELPLLRHSGIVLRLEAPGNPERAMEWIKIEFAKEGLDFASSAVAPQISNSYLIEPVELQDVSPLVLADCLQRSKHRTYNAATWNCNNVTDMIWDELLTGSGGGHTPPPGHDAGTCIICLDRPRDIAFVPCGHFNTCSDCAHRLQRCPSCNAGIQRRQRIFAN